MVSSSSNNASPDATPVPVPEGTGNEPIGFYNLHNEENKLCILLVDKDKKIVIPNISDRVKIDANKKDYNIEHTNNTTSKLSFQFNPEVEHTLLTKQKYRL